MAVMIDIDLFHNATHCGFVCFLYYLYFSLIMISLAKPIFVNQSAME